AGVPITGKSAIWLEQPASAKHVPNSAAKANVLLRRPAVILLEVSPPKRSNGAAIALWPVTSPFRSNEFMIRSNHFPLERMNSKQLIVPPRLQYDRTEMICRNAAHT